MACKAPLLGDVGTFTFTRPVRNVSVKSGDAHEVNHRTRILNTKYVLLIVMVMALPYPTGRVARKEECRGQAGLVHACAAQATLPICTLLACACCEPMSGILTLESWTCFAKTYLPDTSVHSMQYVPILIVYSYLQLRSVHGMQCILARYAEYTCAVCRGQVGI